MRGADRARWRQVPVGMRDQGPEEVATRRRLEERLLELFARWGYREAATPTLEYLETLLRGAGPGVGDRVLKLVDAGGEVLALRPEMTVPLARFAAARLLPAGSTPLRLAYAAPVFRTQELGSGRLREFVQVGVELMGEGGTHADAEVIALASEALREAGVPGAVVGVGHAGFLRGVLAALPEANAEAVRDALYRRAFAELSEVVSPGRILDTLRRLPGLRGPDALDRAAALAMTDESAEALEALRAVLAALAVFDLDVPVEVDLGLIRDFDYYTGIVFEAHAARPGMPLLGGGRYDGLLARFGADAPATGFAVGLERVLDAAGLDGRPRPVVAVVYGAAQARRAARAAALLRSAGLAAILVPDGRPWGPVECAVRVDAGGVAVAAGRGERGDEVADVVRRALEGVAWQRM